MRIHAIINRRAGTLIGTDPQDFAERLRKSYAAAGHQLTVDVVEPGEISALLDAAVKAGYDALLIGGGDGSINAAASKLLGTRIALGILPLGTMNRLARELELSLGLDQMTTELAHSEPVQIDVAEVNGHIFLCNSFIGLPPLITERRQELRGQSFWTRLKGYVRLPIDISRNMRRLALFIDDNKQARLVRALSVVVSNNTYAEEAALLPRRRALDEGSLGLYISRHYTFWQTLWLLIRASLGQWHGDPRFERHQLRKLTIDSRHAQLRVSNDGELMKLATPLHYSIRPKALTVLLPLRKAA
jgi:diacylglycerol kinase family enzyme